MVWRLGAEGKGTGEGWRLCAGGRRGGQRTDGSRQRLGEVEQAEAGYVQHHAALQPPPRDTKGGGFHHHDAAHHHQRGADVPAGLPVEHAHRD